MTLRPLGSIHAAPLHSLQALRAISAAIASLRHSFRAAATRAKLADGLHQHDLRHRRVTTWLAEGKNAVHVKEAMGHSDLRTTMGYTHLVRDNLRSLVESAPPQVPAGKRGQASG